MNVDFDAQRVKAAWNRARQRLLEERRADGCWTGELSSSALATATAASALCLTGRSEPADGRRIEAGLRWLEIHQNADGGWGDTADSRSAVPTTLLVCAAARLAGARARFLDRARAYLERTAGRTPPDQVHYVCRLYGEDRTFAVPILTNLALAGLARWEDIPALPFELACLPTGMLRAMHLPVVSYALPALIAIGQLLHRRRPAEQTVLRCLRDMAVQPALRRLELIQPASGGFLEAVPLTSFVVMSLAASIGVHHAVVRHGLQFLRQTQRGDGSWPIDTDLAVWVTTQAVEALSIGEPDAVDLEPTIEWVAGQQHNRVHAYTGARPGGWAWTPRSGGVPDADDTAGALVALARGGARFCEAAQRGGRWLLDLQNGDGGWPTFCRGWNRLAFDRSAPDLTAHALRALSRWAAAISPARWRTARQRAMAYLARVQRLDGSWPALWFGHQATADQANPVFGTARVLAAYRDLNLKGSAAARRGVAYLMSSQGAEGGWGGDADQRPTVEETAVALEALTGWQEEPAVAGRCRWAAMWLADQVLGEGLDRPAPIGLYFARLWYAEKLYPIIWSVAALGRMSRQ